MRNTSRCDEIETRFPGLIEAIMNAHRVQLTGKRKPGKRAAARTARAS
jgi:hypothetical protein